MLKNLVYALITTFAYCIIFNIRGKNTIFASIGGGLTWLIYLITLKYSNSNNLAFFIASIFSGFYSEIMARFLRTPVTTFVICAIIPLVPGGGMYYTMYEFIQGNITKAQTLGIETLSIAGAIAVGILLASSVTRLLMFFNKARSLQKHD